MKATLKVYKEEYRESFIEFLFRDKIAIKVVENRLATMTIEGETEDLEKVQSLMFADDKKIKSVFPQYLTKEEADELGAKLKRKIYIDVVDSLFEYINSGASVHDRGEDIKILYKFWEDHKND